MTTYQTPLSTVTACPDWIDLCHSAIALHMRDREFTIDDVYALVPQPRHHNHYGAMMSAMRKHGVIEEAGYVVSKRASANGRRVLKWRLK